MRQSEHAPIELTPTATPDSTVSTSASELPEDPIRLLAIVGTEFDDGLRRKAFSSLVKRKRKAPGLVTELVGSLRDTDAIAMRWTVAELYWGLPGEQRDAAVENALAPLLPEATMEIGSRVLCSRWLSREHPPCGTPSATVHARLDYHPLLAVDELGRWPAAGLNVGEDSQLFAGALDQELAGWSILDLPVARELVTRRGILEIRQPRCEIDALDPRVLKAVVKGLERVIVDLEQMFKGDHVSASDVVRRLELALVAGRSPDLWGRLDRARAKLVKVAPADPTEAALWSTAITAMPAASHAVLTALRDVPDASLVALLEAALAQELGGFVGAIQDIAHERARNGLASEHFWRRLGEIGPASAKLERWWRNIMAPLAPSGTVAFDAETSAAVLLGRVQGATIEQLTASTLEQEITGLKPVPRFYGMIRLLVGLQRAIGATRERILSTASSDFQVQLQQLGTVRRELISLFGVIPEPIRVSANAAEAAISAALRRLESAPSEHPAGDPVTVVRQRATDIDDLLTALYDAERDREEPERRRMMHRIRGHLAWAAHEAPHLLDPIGDELHQLPPEAIGAVLRTALDFRIAVLLRNLDIALTKSGTVAVIWRAILRDQASCVPGDLKLPEALCVASADLLAVDVAEAKLELQDWQSGRPLAQLMAQPQAATQTLRSALHEIQQRFNQIIAGL